MIKPTPAEIDRYIVDAGFSAQLPAATVVLIRDVLRPERFSSWACVKDVAGDWQAWPVRTVPTANELEKAGRHKDGTAIIRPGVLNPECWQRGYHSPAKHGQSRPCLRQVGPIQVNRDDDGDGDPEWSFSSKSWSNAQGINLHDFRGSSAGCPTMQRQALVNSLLGVCAEHKVQRWGMLCVEPLFTCES